jgi:hypothetical protein
MMNKFFLLLFMTFAMTAHFCLAQDNSSSGTSQNQPQPELEDSVVSLDLTKTGHKVTLSGEDQEIPLKKGQHLIITVNGDATARYQLIYSEPVNTPIAVDPIPSIYYTLENPDSKRGWYNGIFGIPVLKEQKKLNTTTADSMSFHFLASNPGTKKITITVFDDTGRTWSDNIQTYSYDTVASFELMVTVK